NTKGDFRASDQLQTTDLVLQPGIGQGLQLIKDVELIGICHILEEGDGRKLGVDQSVGLQLGFGPFGQQVWLYHCPPRRLSMRRKDSYREIMSPWAMTSNGERPLKNSLWL